MTSRLPPLQTVRADFPHTAYPRTLAEACVRGLGLQPEPTWRRSAACRSTHLWEQAPCITRHRVRGRVPGRGPSLHRSYPVSTLLRPPPTPAQARSRLCLPLISRGGLRRTQRRRSRSPRFLTDLSTPAVPFHPEEPGRCECSLLRGRYQASPNLEGWPLPFCVTRPNRVHACALRLTPSPSRASTA